MNNKQIKPYESPEIALVLLDHEISLQLASDPDPMGEPDWTSKAQDNFTSDPYQLI